MSDQINKEELLSFKEQELLQSLRGLGIQNKDDLLAVFRNQRQKREQDSFKTQSPYNSSRQDDGISKEKLLEILKQQSQQIKQLQLQSSRRDIKVDVLNFLKDNQKTYILSASLPTVQEAIALHYANVVSEGGDATLEEVVAFHEKMEFEKYQKIKQKENEVGGELYPKHHSQYDEIAKQAEKIEKQKEELEKEPEEGEELESEVDKILSEGEKSDIERKRKEASSDLAEERGLEKEPTNPEGFIDPKKISKEVDVEKLESILNEEDKEEIKQATKNKVSE